MKNGITQLAAVFVFMLSPLHVAALGDKKTVDIAAISNAGIQFFSVQNDRVFSGGQPSAEQFETLRQARVKHIINLRPTNEMDWDQAALIDKLGMQYHSIPVAGAKDINIANAKALYSILDAVSPQPVFVYCASGNRVGALVAMAAAHIEGLSSDLAIEKGKQWGLTQLEPVVRQKLQQPQ